MKEEGVVVGKVFSPGVAEDAALENMGYRPGKPSQLLVPSNLRLV